jgi:hypothetical protein
MMDSKLYYEAHVTLEPVLDNRQITLRLIALKYDFRVADLLMKKRDVDTPTRSKYDSFLTTRDKNLDAIQRRVRGCVEELKAEGFDVWRFKIEDTIMDSQLENYPDMPTVSNRRRDDKQPFTIPPEQM